MSLPEPLTPPSCDLRGLLFMPLDAQRLRDSDLALFATGDEFKAAVLLWCASWHRVPAGSLPDDDRALCRFSGLDPKAWRKAREGAMRGWIKCADGLLYHDVVAEKALEAWKDRLAYRAKRDRDRERLSNWRAEQSGKRDGNDIETPDETRFETLPEEKGSGGKGSGELKDADASSAGSAEPMPAAKGKSEPWLKDAAFLDAWRACTEQGRTRSSKKQAWAAWRLNPASPEAKLAALKAYLAGDPDVRRTGGPGLHLWLRDKLAEWLDRGAPTPSPAKQWHGPERVLRLMEPGLGHDKARDYLAAYCTWQEVPYEAVIVSTEPMAKLIRSKCGKALEAAGIAILIQGRAA